jgi:hypothetical protein
MPLEIPVFNKAIIFSPHSEGRRLVDFVHINRRGTPGLWKTAASREYSPEVMAMIRDLKPEPGNTYSLINALGAGEFWSSNSNADYFAEDQLNPEGTEKYGFATFRKFARPYKHHINKPDSPAYGSVMGNVYNPRMHRVELLVKVANHLAPDIAERIEAGEDVPVSMGCKVPYDVCSICSNEAKSTAEYCDHMQYYPNKIMEDGRKVFVFNIRPRFFDISFVFVGADPTARVLSKVATPLGMRRFFPSGLWAHKLGYDLMKGAEIGKDAEIEKRIEGTATDALKAHMEQVDSGVKVLSKKEEKIKCADLAKMAAACGGNSINGALATLSQAGIVLSPAEFQYMTFSKIGRHQQAKQAWDAGYTFREDQADNDGIYREAYEHYDFSVGSTVPNVAKVAARYIEKRSAFMPFLGARAETMAQAPDASDLESARPPSGRIPPSTGAEFAPFLGSLAAMYAAYRDKIPSADMGMLDKLVAKNPALLVLLSGLTAGGVMGINKALAPDAYTAMQGATKTAVLESPLARVLGIPAMAYLYSGHQQRRRWRGEQLGPLDTVMADYPWLGALGGIGLAQKISTSPMVSKMASMVSHTTQQTLRMSGNRSLMDYKAVLDLTKLAEHKRLGGNLAGPLRGKEKA